MYSFLGIEVLQKAFLAWRKHWIAWTVLWFIFIAVFFVYFCTALVMSFTSPLLAILIYVVGCLLPSYVYGAFIQAGLQQYDHPRQIIEKHFFSYFSIGAAFDIFVARILLIVTVIGLSFVFVPIRYALACIIPEHIVFYSVGIVCLYTAYIALYFYPYAIVDSHQRNVFKITFLYAYNNIWYCMHMTLIWFFAIILTTITCGMVGFFALPILTLADISVYKKSKQEFEKSKEN